VVPSACTGRPTTNPTSVDAQRAGEDPLGVADGDTDAAATVIDAGHAARRDRL
jgi:hypothetical protein